MSQSNVIAGSFFLAFIVYITVKGELPTYINLLKGNTTTTNSTGSTATVQNNLSTANNVIQGAQNLENEVESINISGNAPAEQ